MCEVLPPLSIVSCVCVRVWIYARSKIWHTTTSSDRPASEPKLMMPSPAEQNPLFQHWTVSTQRVSKRAEPSGASWLMILSINKGFWTVVWPSHRRRRVRADFGSGRLAGGAGTDLITNLFRLFWGWWKSQVVLFLSWTGFWTDWNRDGSGSQQRWWRDDKSWQSGSVLSIR